MKQLHTLAASGDLTVDELGSGQTLVSGGLEEPQKIKIKIFKPKNFFQKKNEKNRSEIYTHPH